MKKIHLIIMSLAAAVMLLPACSAESKLKMQIAAASAQCPEKVDEGMTMADIIEENNNLVYLFEIDEEKSEMSVADIANPMVSSIMKEAMKESFLDDSDEDIKELIDLCREAKYGVIFRFSGKPSGESVDISIAADEL